LRVTGVVDKESSQDKVTKYWSRLSPYLIQHTRKPVDWYPQEQKVFDKATQEDRPIFLSIGYSTCHRCHMMERGSFEEDEVSGLMNNVFAPIKVYREEGPDIGNVYMTACQLKE